MKRISIELNTLAPKKDVPPIKTKVTFERIQKPVVCKHKKLHV